MNTYQEVVKARVEAARVRIAEAAEASGRTGDAIELVVATKALSPEQTDAVLAAGVSVVGESRAQELRDKAAVWDRWNPQLDFIGTLQTNKLPMVLDRIDRLHTVDRISLADALERRLSATDRVLDVFTQVNVSGEPSKSGVAVSDAVAFAEEISQRDHLRLRGLMTIGLHAPDNPAEVQRGYATLAQLRDVIVASSSPRTDDAVELSMGMSGDLELAIAAGATIVRVGTAITGPRQR